jgi:catechol 2,3-dioxygenase-like lactoylglutathione lyase family enzyme
MAISFSHTIVPARDKHVSAAFIVRILGVSLAEPFGHFIPVRINESTSLDYANISELSRLKTTEINPQHYAFAVDDAEFDAIMGRIADEGLAYYAEPREPQRYGEINTSRRRRTVYFDDPDGHVFEVMTATQ